MARAVLLEPGARAKQRSVAEPSKERRERTGIQNPSLQPQ